MQILVSAPHLSKPTLATIESVARKRFKSLDRLFRHIKDASDFFLEIVVSKTGDEFQVKAKLHAYELVVVTSKHQDLRIAIRNAARRLKLLVKKNKK
jgi:ribosome-associated translation inhibitor RaiA